MICPNCFSDSNLSVCKVCGFDIGSYSETATSLPLYTILNNKYLIGRVLGQGGFGITYKALNIENNRIYCIKEYFPVEFSVRQKEGSRVEANSPQNNKIYQHGKRRFLDEAKMLYQFRLNPIVTKVYDYFEQNGTAYFVMEFLDGMNLKQATYNMGGRIPLDNAKIIFVTIASGLIEIHKQNVLHRDISPENIFLTKDYNIKLIDFGAARSYIKSQNSGMSVLLKPGFAPPEQYKTNGNQGEWTDVYALAMTFYAIVSGKKPIDAMSRQAGEAMPFLSDICPEVSVNNAKVIEKACELQINNRYQNFEELLKDFDIDYTNEKSISLHKSKNTKSTDDVISNQDEVVGKDRQNVSEQTTSRNTTSNTNNVNTSMRKGVFRRIFAKQKPFVIVKVRSKNEGIFPISDSKFIAIGRSKKCNIVIDDDEISRVHCYVRFDSYDNTFILCDNSSNGTFDENARLNKGEKYKYKSGTKINLVNSNCELTFLVN